jgi:RNA polymerase sigma factor for flagellar operon FliA
MSEVVSPELDLRDETKVLRHYAPLVKRIAHHLLARLPKSVQLDDLIQAGMMGLLDALKNFDNSKGASFSTYAGIRIRGGILDEVRRNDWLPRSIHRNTRKIAEIAQVLENELGRDATDSEIAKKLNISLHDYHQMLCDSNSGQMQALDEIGLNEDYSSNGLVSTIHEPLESLQIEDFTKRLFAGIESLPEREKLVLALYYDEELNLKEIGEILRVSESRVCQILSQAMLRLRSGLPEWQTPKKRH